ncbi:TPR-like protein [Coniochaeta sp. PMI_546]|nr:TPR-like protein [Coniochaeta sp. PMI_546]
MVRLSYFGLAAGLLSSVYGVEVPSDTPVSSLLATAQSYLSRGQTTDALAYYDAAVARDPSNYLTFFKRGATYLSLGRTGPATDDFEKVLSLKPGFEGAHVQLGRIKARGGEWDAAREQYLLAKKKADAEELAQLAEAERSASLAESAAAHGNWDECVRHADVAIQVASRSLSLRELRSRCRFEAGMIAGGISDLLHVLQMKPGDTSPHVKISATQFFALGERIEGMNQIRKCLISDQDSKICRKLLREEKAIDKTIKAVETALERKQPATAAKQLVPSGDNPGLIKEVKDSVAALRADGTIPATAGNALVSQLVGMACQAYYTMKKADKAKLYCEESLQLDENSLYGLLHRARVQREAEDFEAAINTLNKAKQLSQDEKVHKLIDPLLEEAQVALKRSKTKDYYKVLGVANDADDRQIKAAYRKLTKIHHPDKAAKQGLTKEEAEKKMQAINEAYEVLSDPELRARFDRGDDPNSHEQQNPFQQGGPFGGGRPFMFQQGGPGGGSQHFQFQFGGNGFPFGGH